jgi:hypothetical protein
MAILEAANLFRGCDSFLDTLIARKKVTMRSKLIKLRELSRFQREYILRFVSIRYVSADLVLFGMQLHPIYCVWNAPTNRTLAKKDEHRTQTTHKSV